MGPFLHSLSLSFLCFMDARLEEHLGFPFLTTRNIDEQIVGADLIFVIFLHEEILSDPGVPGVRSMGPVVSH